MEIYLMNFSRQSIVIMKLFLYIDYYIWTISFRVMLNLHRYIIHSFVFHVHQFFDMTNDEFRIRAHSKNKNSIFFFSETVNKFLYFYPQNERSIYKSNALINGSYRWNHSLATLSQILYQLDSNHWQRVI